MLQATAVSAGICTLTQVYMLYKIYLWVFTCIFPIFCFGLVQQSFGELMPAINREKRCEKK